MQLNEFKLKRNKQKPEMCYSYVKKLNNLKYTIYTMNYGRYFMAYVEQKRIDGRYYDEFEKKCDSIEECLNEFEKVKI